MVFSKCCCSLASLEVPRARETVCLWGDVLEFFHFEQVRVSVHLGHACVRLAFTDVVIGKEARSCRASRWVLKAVIVLKFNGLNFFLALVMVESA